MNAKINKSDGHWTYEVEGHRAGIRIGLCLPEDADEFDLDILFTLVMHHVDRVAQPAAAPVEAEHGKPN